MSFQQIISILIARKRIIRNVFAFVVITVTVLSLVMPKQYTAMTTVVIDVKTPDPVVGAALQPMSMPGYIATQIDIITSERVGRRVVKLLGFEKVPALVDAWRDDTDGKGSFEGYYAEKLGKKLDVKPSKESDVISIEFTSGDPKTAMKIANAYAEVYLATNLELTVEPARQYTDWFAERTKQVREKLEKQQSALSALQKEKGIVADDERLDVENVRLNDLSTQLTILETQKSEAQSRQHEAKAGLDSNPDVMNNPVIQNLRATITTAEGKLREAENTFGQNYPQIKEQKAELEALRARLKTEMANVASSLGTNTVVSEQKEAEIRLAIELQRKRILDLKKQRDEVTVLQKDIEFTQLDYNNINARLSQSSLQSQNPQTNVAVLTPAFEPDSPSKPRVLINIIVSIFLGAMIGVGVAMLMELSDRRIRSESDLAAIGVPVLGGLNVVRKPKPISRWRFWRRSKLAMQTI
jgi:chain length determinant protein EpsF